MSKDEEKRYILTISCPDTVGIVAAVSGFLSDHGDFISESSHFGDSTSKRFFMRTVYLERTPVPLQGDFDASFSEIAERFSMDWQRHDAEARVRVMILVSRFDHCLNDILYRYRTGDIAIDIPAILSNHSDLAPLAEWHGIPFHHLPLTPETREQQEAKILELVDEHEIDLVVLARYMQILSSGMCDKLKGRIINIHHSFLPSFKGGKPYHQAHARGVKLIGATAHYVSDDLDDGPVIEQAVERVDHTFTPEKLISVGRDIENVVLARAIRYHVEHRVLLNGMKTVVFK
jgi:formyltetrahydrofolate deformylase